jgi:hypothetical protein
MAASSGLVAPAGNRSKSDVKSTLLARLLPMDEIITVLTNIIE